LLEEILVARDQRPVRARRVNRSNTSLLTLYGSPTNQARFNRDLQRLTLVPRHSLIRHRD
jgi:hypothetical protein